MFTSDNGTPKQAQLNQKVKKTVFKLESPFPRSEWPRISAEDQSVVVDLMCALLKPLGQQRQQVQPAKGKRARKRKHEELKGKQAGEVDDVTVSNDQQTHERPHDKSKHFRIGLNSVTRHLEALITGPQEDCDYMAVVVLVRAQDNIVYSHLPVMCNLASARHASRPPVRIVFLESNVERRLIQALAVQRVGVLGFVEGSNESAALINFIRQRLAPVPTVSTEKAADMVYQNVNIRQGSNMAIATTALP